MCPPYVCVCGGIRVAARNLKLASPPNTIWSLGALLERLRRLWGLPEGVDGQMLSRNSLAYPSPMLKPAPVMAAVMVMVISADACASPPGDPPQGPRIVVLLLDTI